ncbi:MAG: ABC transporter ATP-binding protein [Caldimonas sp.]
MTVTAEPTPVATPPCISLRDVSVVFEARGRRVPALSEATLDIAEGEFVALLGPTGCGKSTLLRIVSDLLRPSSGTLTVRGASAAEARRRNDFGFVFQEAALLPWRTALANIELPLEVVGYPPAQRAARCSELLAGVGLANFGHSYPSELSGGMKQRVSIARALSWNPSILLMDEPFSALDEITKNQLQDELLRIWQRERKTIVFVTHNISEAVYLADRVVVMSAHPGRIRQVIEVALPRERGPEIRDTIEFIEQVRVARRALQP